MMGEHERLENPTAAEVVFEVRFLKHKSLEDYVKAIETEFFSEYPVKEDIKHQGFGVKFSPEGAESNSDLPLVRYKSQQGHNIVQLGQEILTVNTTNYAGFENFAKTILQVVERHNKTAEVQSYRRFGLRYINHIGFTSPDKVFSWIAPLPPDIGIEKGIVSNVQDTLFRFTNGDFQKVAVAYPAQLPNGQYVMIFDIDHFVEFATPNSCNMTYIENWLQTAHEYVWQTYVGGLERDFYDSLKLKNS